jgi:transcription antitermination factor NusA-like protein
MGSTLRVIQPVLQPAFDVGEMLDSAALRFAYGARSEAAVYVGELLARAAPSLAADGGQLEIVAIARRPGVLSKVAIRPRPGAPAPLAIGIGADHVARVRELLDGERIHIVVWQRSASAYIADALGLGPDYAPPVLLQPGLGHARVLLGEIDVRGIAGWRGLNTVLASALTGWRIRLEPVAATAAWQRLLAAMVARRPVLATVVARTPRGVRVEVLGLYALLTTSSLAEPRPGQELEVRLTRMDADEGRIFVSDRRVATSQMVLPLGLVAVKAHNSNTTRG